MTQLNLFSDASVPPSVERTSAKTVGDRLKAFREKRMLDIPTVSDDLSMSVFVIEEIENGEIEKYYKEIFALVCRYAVGSHDVFAGFFVHSERMVKAVQRSIEG